MTVPIYNFVRVNPSNFDSKKISHNPEVIPGTTRHKIMYDYGGNELKELHLVLPFDEDAYVILDAFTKEVYKGVETGKYKSSFVLMKDNRHHVEMFAAFSCIMKRFSKQMNKEVKFPCSETADGVRVYVGLIQSKDNIYTSFYNKKEPLDT
jgi:hypothetical protein